MNKRLLEIEKGLEKLNKTYREQEICVVEVMLHSYQLELTKMRRSTKRSECIRFSAAIDLANHDRK